MSVVVGTFVRFGNKARRRDASDEQRLPIGAEAALWSILEAVPDPRNHLALVRDLSGEVRVTDVEQAMLMHAYENRVPDRRDGPVIDVREEAPPAMDPYYDLGQIAENAPLTNHLFTPSPD